MVRELEDPLFGTVLRTGVEGRITAYGACFTFGKLVDFASPGVPGCFSD
jgi:hypothetical protein